jgi:hypothetical protein
VNPTTGAGTVVLQSEVFDANAGGTAAAFSALSTTRYWQTSINSGSGNFTNTLIRLNDTRGSFDAIGSSATLAGVYSLVGGGSPTLATSSITSVTPASTSIANFYLMGTKAPPVLSSLTITPAGNQCTNVARTVTVVATPAAASITGVQLSYTVNGGGATNVAMTNTTGNTWSGVIPTVTPSNGTVAWSVLATDGNGLTATQTGTSYADVPLQGVSGTSSASLSTVCANAPTTLTALIAKAGTVQLGTSSTANANNTNVGAAYPTFYGNGRQQYLVLGSELQALGLKAGNITSLAFDVSVAGTGNNLNGYTIKLATTAATSIVAFQTPTFTTVFGPTNITPAAGVNTHTFTTNFAWDGTSNLIVDLCFSNGTSGTTSTQNLTKQTATAFASTVGYQIDGATAPALAACSQTTASVSGSIRPNMIFGGNAFNTSVTYSWSDGTSSVGSGNPLVVNPAANTTYTATATDANGCTVVTSSTAITTLSIPATPTGSNSTQCGLAAPGASVSGAGGTFKWYSASTGGTLLQTGGSTYATPISTTTIFYVAESNGTCESSRVAVTATVTSPDAVSASSGGTNCMNATKTLTATQTGSNNTYVYVWTASPASGSGIPSSVSGSPATITPTATGTYIYTVTATDATAGCTTTATTSATITALPAISTLSATPSTVCSQGSIALAATSVGFSAGTANVGTQTSVSTTASPYRSGFGTDMKTQYLFTAAELTAAGISAGNITSIAFNVTTLGNLSMGNFTIKMGHTSASSVGTSFDASSLTTVLNPVTYTAVSGTNTHTFNTAFNWNGTSNLIVQVCHDAQAGTSSTVAQSTPAAVSATYLLVSGACASNATATTSATRPTVTFGAQISSNVASSYTWSWTPGNLSGATTTATAPVNTSGSPITQAYTVTATNGTTGCFNTGITSNVTVNPAPAAPTGSNSSQCGTGVPAASVASVSGLPTPSFKWYSAASAGTLLQNSTSTTYATSISATTTFYVAELNATTGCESPRTPVTATVTLADAVTAAAGSACLNTALSLSASKAGSTNTYTYSWTASPATGSGIPTGTASGNPASVTPTATGTYLYTVTAFDATLGCTATSSISVTVNPLPIVTTVTATPSSVCAGGTIALSATGSVTTSGTSTQGAGASTSSSAATSPFNHTYGATKTQLIFRQSELTALGIPAGNITSLSFYVTSLGTSPLASFSINMGHTAQTTAISDAAITAGLTSVYTNASQALTVGTNTYTFTTPFAWNGTSNIVVSICWSNQNTGGSSSTVSMDAAGYTSSLAIVADNVTAAVMLAANTGASTNAGSFSYDNFTSNSRAKVSFGWTSVSNVTGTYNWNWTPGNLSGASVNATAQGTPGTQTFTATATNPTTGCTKTGTVDVVVGATLLVSAGSAPATVCAGSSATLTATPSGGGAPYSYSWKDANNTVLGTTVSISVAPTVTSVYTVTVTDNCGNSTPQNVTVTVNALPTVSVTPTGAVNVCSGSQVLTSSTNAASAAYQWQIGGVAIGSATGSTYTALAGGVYTLKVTDGVTSCFNTSASSTLTFPLLPSAVTMTPTSNTICLGVSQTLGASATVPTTLLSENFNSGAPTWTVSSLSTTSVGVPITNVNWYNQAAGYTDVAGTVTFSNFSIDGTTFAYANSDAGGSGSRTRTALTSPAFSTVGYNTASLGFKHVFQYWSSGDSLAAVQYSTDGTTWLNMKTYTSDQGTTTSNAQAAVTEAITLPAGALNQPSVRIRFNYVSTWGYVWIIDNVSLAGTPPAVQYAWSSAAGSGLTSGQQLANSTNNSISVTPTAAGNYTYTVTASVAGSSCTTTNTVAITVNAPSVAPSSLSSTASGTICNGTSVDLTQNAGTLGTGAYWQWYTNASFTSTIGGHLTGNAFLTVTPSSTTTYYLRAEGGTAPCDPTTAALSVIVNVYTPTVVGTAAGSQTICNGSTPSGLTLTGSNGSIQWQSSSDAAFTSPTNLGTSATQSIGAISQSTYYRALVNSGGCNQLISNTVSITVNNPSVAPVTLNASASGTQCAGTNIILTQTGGSLGAGAWWQWYSNPEFTATVGGQLGSANAQITVAPSATTTYYLRAEGTTAPCTTDVPAAVSKTITIYSPTIAGVASADQSICTGATPLALSLVGMNGNIVWQSSTDANFSVPGNIITYASTTATLPAVQIGALSQTRYFRALVNNGGCTELASNTVTITVTAYPTAYTLSGGGSYCNSEGRELKLSSSQSGVNYQLKESGNPVGSVVAGTGSELNFGFYPAGIYTVTGTNTTNCETPQTGTATVTNLGQFSAQISAQNSILCQAGSFTTITISSGPANGSVVVTTNGNNPQTYSLNASGLASFQTGALSSNATYTITSVSNGVCATLTSISTSVYVGALIANPNASPTVCAGTSVTGQNFTGQLPERHTVYMDSF